MKINFCILSSLKILIKTEISHWPPCSTLLISHILFPPCNILCLIAVHHLLTWSVSDISDNLSVKTGSEENPQRQQALVSLMSQHLKGSSSLLSLTAPNVHIHCVKKSFHSKHMSFDSKHRL